jgi:hypothetical protein
MERPSFKRETQDQSVFHVSREEVLGRTEEDLFPPVLTEAGRHKQAPENGAPVKAVRQFDTLGGICWGREAPLDETSDWNQRPAAQACEAEATARSLASSCEPIRAGVMRLKARFSEQDLTANAAAVELSISDCGAGFDLRVTGAGRLGLLGVAERARPASGDPAIVSRPGAGAEVRVRAGEAAA